MKQKIRIQISNKIFKKENIKEIAEYILMQEDKLTANCKVNFKNGQEVESDDTTIFESRKFQEYEINFIHINYWKKNLERYIEMYIYNYDNIGMSSVNIMSNDSDWLAIVEKNIKEKLFFCDKQSEIGCIFGNFYIAVILSLLMSAMCSIVTGKFISKIISFDIEGKLGIICVCFVVFFIIYMNLLRNLKNAFPKVEIAISDKNNSSKRKRDNIILVSTSLILPIVLNFVYDLIKFFMK